MIPNPGSASASNPSQNGSTKMVIVGLVLAASAVILVNLYAKALVEKSQETTFTVYTFVNGQEANHLVRADMLQPTEVPVRFKGSLGDVVDADTLKGYISGQKMLRRSASPKQLLTHDFFMGGKETDPKQDPITPGKVSVAIKVENLPAALEPGDFVDLQAQVPAGTNRSGMKVIGVMEHVRVIAKGEIVVSENSGNRPVGNVAKIDIELSPENAMQIKNIQKAMGGAAFEVTVRNRKDSAPHGTVANMNDVNEEVFKALGIQAYRAQN